MAPPTTFSPALAELICERIADGQTLREVCRSPDMPGRETVRRWLRDDPDFDGRYAKAIEQRSDAFLEDIFEIADDATNDWMDRRRADGTVDRVPDPEQVARSKLRIAARQWAMARCAPKKYGDRLAVGGDPNAPPIQVEQVSPLDKARTIAFALSKVERATRVQPSAEPPRSE